eukprot:TRINITY_DN6579_c0_g1_i2.p1 TRINITY_DN6579_c0_g1~~TRINITY_DN6579_c0_g1_i2.p1  ORF type:complete len:567 (+),score=37.83 TRINITY_DN6579_c0_g1_i2:99-1703(+)
MQSLLFTIALLTCIGFCVGEFEDDELHVVWSDGAPVTAEDLDLARQRVERELQLFVIGADAYGFNLTNNPALIHPYATSELVFNITSLIGATLETPYVHRHYFYLWATCYEVLACINGWQSYFGEDTCPGPPGREFTPIELTIAIAYAQNQRAASKFYYYTEPYDELFQKYSYDPDDNSTDISTPAGFGNVIGKKIYEYYVHDGYNEDGTITRMVNPMPFDDFSGYAPVNSPEELVYPLRWQPLKESDGRGFFYFQQHVAPFIPFVKLHAVTQEEMMGMKVEWPYATERDSKELKEEDVVNIRNQAQELFDISANLTEVQKLLTYFFDSKTRSLGFLIFNSLSLVYTPEQLKNDSLIFWGQQGYITALHDSTVVVWKEKLRHDAVRPTSIIEYLLDNEQVTAWGGENNDMATQMKAKEFVSYLRTMPHSEYPSGSACVCEASIGFAREFTGVDVFDKPYSIVFLPGGPNVAPTMQLSKTTVVFVRSHSELSRLCAESRLWGGFHFRPAIEAGADLCKGIGKLVNDRLYAKIHST